MAQQLETIEQWVAMLREADLPVLGSTVIELRRIQEDEDGATPQRVADAVLHDPFMTVKVLLYLQEHRGRRRNADITTIPHALMMLGMSPFFDHFGVQMALEDWLTNDAASLSGVRGVMSRARHAALYARDWRSCVTTSIPKKYWLPLCCTTWPRCCCGVMPRGWRVKSSNGRRATVRCAAIGCSAR